MLGRVLDLRRGALRQQHARGRDQRLSGPRLLLGPPGSEIEKITVEGQCTTVVIATSLADADTATAKRMCDAASEIAYVGEVNSVRVLSAAGHGTRQRHHRVEVPGLNLGHPRTLPCRL